MIMKMLKTADLIGCHLDWAVTYIELERRKLAREYVKVWVERNILDGCAFDPYSTCWTWGGEIIERQRIHLCPVVHDGMPAWSAWDDGQPAVRFIHGVALTAAMRAYVQSVKGEGLAIPAILGAPR